MEMAKTRRDLWEIKYYERLRMGGGGGGGTWKGGVSGRESQGFGVEVRQWSGHCNKPTIWRSQLLDSKALSCLSCGWMVRRHNEITPYHLELRQKAEIEK